MRGERECRHGREIVSFGIQRGKTGIWTANGSYYSLLIICYLNDEEGYAVEG